MLCGLAITSTKALCCQGTEVSGGIVMEFRADRTWVGAGIKVQGIAIVGASSFEGIAIRMDSIENEWHEFNITSINLGIGLGGSVGAALFVGFNMGMLEWANGMSVTDWGINIALPEIKVPLDDIGASLELYKYLDGTSFLPDLFARSVRNGDRFSQLRDFSAWLWASGDYYGTGASTEPIIMVLDVPGAGGGLEVSAFLSGGEFNTSGKTFRVL